MLSVFVLTSYSAIIVSLLQTSSDAINTLTELMDSSFRLSMEDISYNTNYVNVGCRKMFTYNSIYYVPSNSTIHEMNAYFFYVCWRAYIKY